MTKDEPKFLGKTKLNNNQVDATLIETSDDETGTRIVHSIACQTPCEILRHKNILTGKQVQQSNDYLLTWERCNYSGNLSQPNLESPLGSIQSQSEMTESQVEARQRIKEIHNLVGAKYSKILWYACGYCHSIEHTAWRLSYTEKHLIENLKLALDKLIELVDEGQI